MLEFFRGMARERAFEVKLPGLVLSFLIAEFFYKFHSFTLECLAFLATWLVLDVIIDRLFASRRARNATAGPR